MADRILIVRTDRIGDVLLTTPIATALRRRFPKAHITWLTRAYTAPLFQHNSDVDEVLIDEGSTADLTQRLRNGRFDTAIIAHPRWRVAWATWRAGIPLRIGPASKIYSALFTHRVWQHRSEGAKHEADYNLDLLEPLGIPFQRLPTRLVLSDEETAWARKTLESHRLTFQKPIIGIHPGSGGSSGRWPLSHFMELGDRLQEAGYEVVITGGPGEDYQYLMIDHMRRIPVFIAAGSVSVRELAALLGQFSLFVTNSTGPLHMAVALGVPTVSVFSPQTTCHPKRWGPYPDYPEGGRAHGVAVAPSTEMTQADMRAVTVEQVWELCRERLAEWKAPARSGQTAGERPSVGAQ